MRVKLLRLNTPYHHRHLPVLLILPGLSSQCKFANFSEFLYLLFLSSENPNFTNCHYSLFHSHQLLSLSLCIYVPLSIKSLHFHLHSEGVAVVFDITRPISSVNVLKSPALSLSKVLKLIVYFLQRFCSNLEIKRGTNSYPS